MKTEEIVEFAEKLKEKDLEWKPLYPNNMPCNGLCGCYCFLWIKNKEGEYSGRKYTILFQEKENEKGCVQKGEVEFYVLFEKSYYNEQEPFVYPEPSNSSILASGKPTDIFDINSYGTFIRAYTSENKARERALIQFKMIFSYAMSHLANQGGKKK